MWLLFEFAPTTPLGWFAALVLAAAYSTLIAALLWAAARRARRE